MPLEQTHARNLTLATDEQSCVRVIPAHSSHWLPHPAERATSGAFDDSQGEVSIDLMQPYPSAEQLQGHYAEKIASKGIGLACCTTVVVRAALLAKEIVGNVWHDPVTENDIHGIITGPQTRKKKTTLQENFKVEVKPKSPQEVFGN